MWTPCSPGVIPATSTSTITPSLAWLKLAKPTTAPPTSRRTALPATPAMIWAALTPEVDAVLVPAAAGEAAVVAPASGLEATPVVPVDVVAPAALVAPAGLVASDAGVETLAPLAPLAPAAGVVAPAALLAAVGDAAPPPLQAASSMAAVTAIAMGLSRIEACTCSGSPCGCVRK